MNYSSISNVYDTPDSRSSSAAGTVMVNVRTRGRGHPVVQCTFRAVRRPCGAQTWPSPRSRNHSDSAELYARNVRGSVPQHWRCMRADDAIAKPFLCLREFRCERAPRSGPASFGSLQCGNHAGRGASPTPNFCRRPDPRRSPRIAREARAEGVGLHRKVDVLRKASG